MNSHAFAQLTLGTQHKNPKRELVYTIGVEESSGYLLLRQCSPLLLSLGWSFVVYVCACVSCSTCELVHV